jgi:predicted nicotinamide N-methyase
MSFAPLERALQRTLPMARIEPHPLPGCEAITLGLINPDFPTGPLPGDVVRSVLASPAYWSLCWGSGLALARLLLDDPTWVRGKSVLDLGSGSGVVAIAAALAGAASVAACDTDPDARLATATNAELNGVAVDVFASSPGQSDMILMADVLYDRQNLALLESARASAAEVLVADSRIHELPDDDYRKIAKIDALTYPNLGEFDEFTTAHVFHWSAGA